MSGQTRYWPYKAIMDHAEKHGLTLKKAVAELLEQGIFPEHFKRNQGLIDRKEQIRLLDLPIFIAGCGGLGGEIAAHLAHLGAGKLFLCDFDVFEESNSNRQRFCDISSMGRSKARATAEALAKKIPWGDFQALELKIVQDNPPDSFMDCAVIMDCLDSVAGKRMLENMAEKSGKTWIHGSVLEHEGFACLKTSPAGVLESLYGQEASVSGAGSVLSHVVAGTAAIMISLFVKWLANPDYQSPLIHMDFSIPEMENFTLT